MATLNQLTQLHYFLSKSPISRTRFISAPHSCPSTPPQHTLSMQIPHLSLSLKPQWPDDMDWTGCGPFDEGDNFQMSERDESSPKIDDKEVPFQHANKTNRTNQEHGVETTDDEDEEDINSDAFEGPLSNEEEENNCGDPDPLSTPHRKRKRTSSHSNDAFILVPRRWKSEDEDEDDSISTNGSCALYEVDDDACSVSSSSSSSSKEEFMIATSWERNGMPSKRAKTRAFGAPLQTDADETPELDYETVTGDEDEDGMSGGEDPVYSTLSNGDFIGAGSGSPRFNLITRKDNHCGDRVANSSPPRVLKVWGWIAPTVRRRGGHRVIERAQQSSKGRKAKVMGIERRNKKEDDEDNEDAWAWGHCVRCKRVERAGMWCVCRSGKGRGSNNTVKEEEFGDDGVVFVSQEWDYEFDGEECIEISVDDMDSCSLAREYEQSAADYVPPCDGELEHDQEEELDQEELPTTPDLEEPLSEASAFASTCSLAQSPPPYDSAEDSEEDNEEEFENQKYEDVGDDDDDNDNEEKETEEGKALPIRLPHARENPGIWTGSAETSSVRAEDWMEVDYIL